MIYAHPVSPKRSLRRRTQKGSALVEGALCFAAMIALLFGAVEFGTAVYAFNACAFAAESGARWASVRGTNSASPATADQVQTVVRNQVVGLTKSKILVTTTWIPDKKPGSVVKVRVDYAYSPMVKLILKSNLALGSTSKGVITN